jgi:two-component system, OmpR family, sensor histidine kinase ArlS
MAIMKQKLLDKTLRTYQILSIIVLLIAVPLFSVFTEKLYTEEADEALLLRKSEFSKFYLKTLKISDINTWNKYSRDVKIEKMTSKVSSDRFIDKNYTDSLKFQTEPYRVLLSPIRIENQSFVFFARVNLVKNKLLVKNFAFLFGTVLFLLLVGLYFITKRLSLRLWRPFYHTLNQIETFEIDSFLPTNQQESDIEEFHRLNLSVENLIQKNVAIYSNQREFVENAAHELQTPLAVFQANIETLIQRSDITQGQSEILQKLMDTASRLNRLNKNLLLLSRIDNHHFNEMTTISVKSLLEKNFNFFAEQAISKNITITKTYGNDAILKTHSFLMEILVSNLFLNAIKHNIENGKIEITLTNKELVFSNSGLQFPLLESKLFQRFSKANSSTQGNGLGLAIIKKIADLNRWTVKYSFQNSLHIFSINF